MSIEGDADNMLRASPSLRPEIRQLGRRARRGERANMSLRVLFERVG